MGKKYIIELPENTHWIQWIMEGTEDHHPYMDFKSVEDLTPYTAPDLEQIREEAYEKGYEDGFVAGHLKAEKSGQSFYEDGHKRGLADAWKAAGWIWTTPVVDLKKCFDLEEDDNGMLWPFHEYTASEAIAKIKEYEDGKLEYHVGDEFENGAGQKFVVLKMDGKEIDRYIDGDGKTYVMDVKYRVMRKTGRHFPEISAVLEKMRGEQE